MDIKNKWKHYWNYPFSPRKGQEQALNEFCEAYDLGYTNIIIHAPVGCGKSHIAMTIAEMENAAYIATSTTQLQKQYVEDFTINEIKGRRHYLCKFQYKRYLDSSYDSLEEYAEEEHDVYCDTCIIQEAYKNNLDWQTKLDIIQTQNNNPDYLYDEIKENGYEKEAMDKHSLYYCNDCEYKLALSQAKESDHLVTNYFMLHILFKYLRFPKKNCIIFDEAHNFERNLIQLFSFSINPQHIYNIHKYDLFEEYHQGYYTYKELHDLGNMESILSEYESFLGKKLNELEKEHGISIDTNSNEKYGIIKVDRTVSDFKQIQMLRRLCSLDYILTLPSEEHIKNGLSRTDEIKFEPRHIGDYANYFYNNADCRVFMTGTLTSFELFCENNGLNPDETYYIKIPSDFPIENRPIKKAYFKYNLGKFSKGDYYVKNNNGKPKYPLRIRNDIITAIQDIIREHPGQKGIIHTTSHIDSKLIKEQLDYPYVWTVNANKNENFNEYPRDELISYFKEYDEPVILVGAGLKDGIDLPDDYCRFNIIFKVPYPGGQYAIQRRNGEFLWYMGETCNPLMQAYGRGMRHKGDQCDTYILDECFEDILSKNKDLLEDYFLEAIES